MKKTFRWISTTILILGGMFLFIFALYAYNQWKWWYRSQTGSTNVYLYTGTEVFNNSKIEEHGICKKIAINNCPKDIFIPTKTTGEREWFIANKPECITFGECCTPNRTPATNTQCSRVVFTQNDWCGNTRQTTGTKICPSKIDRNGNAKNRNYNWCYKPDGTSSSLNYGGNPVSCTSTETLWCVYPYGALRSPGYRVHYTCQNGGYDVDPNDAPPSTYPLCANGRYGSDYQNCIEY